MQMLSSSNQSGRLVSDWGSLEKHLPQRDLAYFLQVPPPQVGCPPENRSGEMVNPTGVRNFGAKIIAHGFVFSKTQNAAAFGAPRDKSEYDAVVAANERLSRLSVRAAL